MSARVLDRAHFGSLLGALDAKGYTVVGPTVADGAIVYGTIAAAEDLPVGWTEEQEAGTYSLVRRDDAALFGYAVGPQSWKRFLFSPRVSLLEVHHSDGSPAFSVPPAATTRYAFLGVRPCEVAAIGIQDQVFLSAAYVDRNYREVRRNALIVAVNCVVPGGTCFCASMGTGPECRQGYDVLLTEVLDEQRHEFVVESGSDAGAEIVDALPTREADETDHGRVRDLMTRAAASMGRSLDAASIKGVLEEALEHPRWDGVAQRCLACANCTLVCPTCFCSTVEDRVGVGDGVATRVRRWDSCFTLDFSGLHGVPVRASTRARYRQWMTHKLASWYDQFGSSGCVGCGRCITWCPVGIDITREAAALAAGGEREE